MNKVHKLAVSILGTQSDQILGEIWFSGLYERSFGCSTMMLVVEPPFHMVLIDWLGECIWCLYLDSECIWFLFK